MLFMVRWHSKFSLSKHLNHPESLWSQNAFVANGLKSIKVPWTTKILCKVCYTHLALALIRTEPLTAQSFFSLLRRRIKKNGIFGSLPLATWKLTIVLLFHDMANLPVMKPPKPINWWRPQVDSKSDGFGGPCVSRMGFWDRNLINILAFWI